ncbi:uncharacterized protein LOC100846871 isoform X2 [Brachypodium distachyon]|uniref:Uncharacterized protein n=1 Tax=Brachypodium distachyon TaxID=15368 RepID=A0A0Q3K113_BRADI|nr:uncharacterized protein LOC100846871 isoform X2 [Brachypodium distachyon]KQK17860.1 hypothetical protein BRADI_1g37205v3 [Brachypodium distachyon]|eukprot:XP_024312693.1 uncharacterized protein LOC100846871 isoform X2 [Brachypodium distachyon]
MALGHSPSPRVVDSLAADTPRAAFTPTSNRPLPALCAPGRRRRHSSASGHRCASPPPRVLRLPLLCSPRSRAALRLREAGPPHPARCPCSWSTASPACAASALDLALRRPWPLPSSFHLVSPSATSVFHREEDEDKEKGSLILGFDAPRKEKGGGPAPRIGTICLLVVTMCRFYSMNEPGAASSINPYGMLSRPIHHGQSSGDCRGGGMHLQHQMARPANGNHCVRHILNLNA